jgi:serine/threonine protein kinase
MGEERLELKRIRGKSAITFATTEQDLPGAPPPDPYRFNYLQLKSQRTILVNYQTKLLSEDVPPNLQAPVRLLVERLVELERCPYVDLYPLARTTIDFLHDLLSDSSLPVDLRVSIDICFKAVATVIRSIYTEMKTSDKHESDFQVRRESDSPDLIVCSICEELVSVHQLETHTKHCIMAYKNDERVHEIDVTLHSFLDELGGMLAGSPWPGDRNRAVFFLLPLLRAYLTVYRVLDVTVQGSGACDECGFYENALALLMRSTSDGSLAKLLSNVKRAVAQKKCAANAYYRSRIILRETQVSGQGRSVDLTSITIADFVFIKLISSGAYGRVYLARKETTGVIYAVKVLPRSEIRQKNQVQRVLLEKDILLRFESPWMTKFFYSILGFNNLYLVVEYVCGGDLSSLLNNVGALDEDTAKCYAFQLSHALSFLHRIEIIHRDIKPDNVLIASDGRLKLTDFGLSYCGLMTSKKPAGQDIVESQSIVGTPDYVAPEILLGKPHSFQVDWWSLGVLTYELVTGTPPFHSEVQNEIYENILRGSFGYPDDIDLSAKCKDFIRSLLVYDPAHRLGAGGSGEVLAHPWFAGLDIDNLEISFRPEPHDSTDTSYFQERYTFSRTRGLDVSIAEDMTRARVARDNRFLIIGRRQSLTPIKPKPDLLSVPAPEPAQVVASEPIMDADDGMTAFPAVSVEQLGGQNREKVRKWIEDHPEQLRTGTASFGSTDELKPATAMRKRTERVGIASDDSVLSIWDKKK